MDDVRRIVADIARRIENNNPASAGFIVLYKSEYLTKSDGNS